MKADSTQEKLLSMEQKIKEFRRTGLKSISKNDRGLLLDVLERAFQAADNIVSVATPCHNIVAASTVEKVDIRIKR